MSDALPNEVTFTGELLIALSCVRGVHVQRQNCGSVPVRDQRGKLLRYFRAGPPVGAADITGGVAPEGWRLEVELKMPGGKRTPAQRAWAAFCARQGYVYALVTYDDAASLAHNLGCAVATVTDAIAARRAA